jgi:hypothetical protein
MAPQNISHREFGPFVSATAHLRHDRRPFSWRKDIGHNFYQTCNEKHFKARLISLACRRINSGGKALPIISATGNFPRSSEK